MLFRRAQDPITHTLDVFPLDMTLEDQTAGFRAMILSLGDFVGPWPGENLKVAVRPLSDCDALIKLRFTTRTGEARVSYRHLRYGYLSWRQQLREIWSDILFGHWLRWLRGRLPGRVEWQHVPNGYYESPAANCTRSL